MELRARLVVFRASVLLWRENRRRRRTLAAELATYTSEADLNDLHAIVDAYPAEQTLEIRQLLRQQQLPQTWSALQHHPPS